MIAWIKRYRIWIAAGIGLLLFIVGLVSGWKWAQALGVVGAGAAGATGLGNTITQPDPMIDGARKTVGDTLEAKRKRQEEAARIRKEMER